MKLFYGFLIYLVLHLSLSFYFFLSNLIAFRIIFIIIIVYCSANPPCKWPRHATSSLSFSLSLLLLLLITTLKNRHNPIEGVSNINTVDGGAKVKSCAGDYRREEQVYKRKIVALNNRALDRSCLFLLIKTIWPICCTKLHRSRLLSCGRYANCDGFFIM